MAPGRFPLESAGRFRCDRFVAGLRYVIITLVLSFVSYGLQILLRTL